MHPHRSLRHGTLQLFRYDFGGNGETYDLETRIKAGDGNNVEATGTNSECLEETIESSKSCRNGIGDGISDVEPFEC